jgi:peptidyl-prolyl cis-trans isomerase B (cyclophilin B)
MANQVSLETSAGVIVIELDDVKAPTSTENFLGYVRSGHYDGTVFHRVIKGFMVQGGGFAVGMKQKSVSAPIQNEAANGLKNLHYTVAMARTSDPHSATAQFFINTANNGFLDHTSRRAGLGLCGLRQGGQGHRGGRCDRALAKTAEGRP